VPQRGGARPRMMILMPSVFCVRNFVHSGLLDRLLQTCDTTVVAPHFHPGFQRPGVTWAQQMPAPHSWGRLYRHFVLALAAAHARRCSNRSVLISRPWFAHHWGPRARLAAAMHDILGALLASGPWYRALDRIDIRMRPLNYDLRTLLAALRANRPSLVLSTCCVDSAELPYVLAARRLGIPTAAAILSFDNLTSRGRRWMGYGHYLVWNEGMREQLLRLYPDVRPCQVFVTGTPQFDFHVKPDYIWSRAEVAHRLGVDPRKHWIVFAGSAEPLMPTGPELVRQIHTKLLDARQLGVCGSSPSAR